MHESTFSDANNKTPNVASAYVIWFVLCCIVLRPYLLLSWYTLLLVLSYWGTRLRTICLFSWCVWCDQPWGRRRFPPSPYHPLVSAPRWHSSLHPHHIISSSSSTSLLPTSLDPDCLSELIWHWRHCKWPICCFVLMQVRPAVSGYLLGVRRRDVYNSTTVTHSRLVRM